MKKLKLYVWCGVLRDYSSGVMFAFAESEEHAKKLIQDKHKAQYDSEIPEGEFLRRPLKIQKPEGFFLYGCG